MGAKFIIVDISNLFLSSHMQDPEYMKIHQDDIPQDILDQYKASQYMDFQGYVYFQITKGMYGLKQAAILAYKQIKGESQQVWILSYSSHSGDVTFRVMFIFRSPRACTNITFCLCVDDFGIKYEAQEDAQHLIAALQEYYKITIDWPGKHYCGLTLD